VTVKLQYGQHMMKTKNTKTRKASKPRSKDVVVQFCAYLSPADFDRVNALWPRMGLASRAEFIRLAIHDAMSRAEEKYAG
jgi:hypothetical protein